MWTREPGGPGALPTHEQHGVTSCGVEAVDKQHQQAIGGGPLPPTVAPLLSLGSRV